MPIQVHTLGQSPDRLGGSGDQEFLRSLVGGCVDVDRCGELEDA